MRVFLFLSTLTIILVLPRSGSAQVGPFVTSVSAGATFPVGNLGDLNKTGVNANAVVGYRAHGSKQTFGIEVGWHQLQQITVPADSLGKVYSNIIVVMARYDHDLSSGVYVTGGFGTVRREFRIHYANIAIRNTDAKLGFAAGLGITLAKRFFAEGRVIYEFSKPKANYMVPLSIGVRF